MELSRPPLCVPAGQPEPEAPTRAGSKFARAHSHDASSDLPRKASYELSGILKPDGDPET